MEQSVEPAVVRMSRFAMACNFEVLLWGRQRDYLEAAAQQALEDVRVLEGQLSAYQLLSEVDQINAAAASRPVRVSPQVFGLLEQAIRISTETGGAFDITVGPLVRCWGFYQRSGRVPSAQEMETARAVVGYQHLRLHHKSMSVSFDAEGVEINLGAVGKGYAVDRIVEYLVSLGIPGALVDAGRSSSYALGTQPAGEAWRLGVEHPLDPDRRVAVLSVSNVGVSNSGPTQQFFEADGVVYGHIIDPRTGWPAQGILSAVAIAPTAAESDALSTAFAVMGVEATRAYCEAHSGVRALLVPRPQAGDRVAPVAVGLNEQELEWMVL